MEKKENFPDEDHKRLFEAILKLNSRAEAASFFRDLLTIGELDEFANRFKMAWLVDEGKSYQEIAHEVGCSTATVTRVAHWLRHGMGGYQLALKRLKT